MVSVTNANSSENDDAKEEMIGAGVSDNPTKRVDVTAQLPRGNGMVILGLEMCVRCMKHEQVVK